MWQPLSAKCPNEIQRKTSAHGFHIVNFDIQTFLLQFGVYEGLVLNI